MNVNEGNINGLFIERLFVMETWSARRTKSCDCMTSATLTIIIYFASLAKC